MSDRIELGKPAIPAVGGFPGYPGGKGSRVDFDPDKFVDLLETKGLPYYWARAGECPCEANTQSGQPDPTCSLCGGDGWYYYHPDEETDKTHEWPYKPVRAIFSNVRMDPSVHERWGEWWMGTATVTIGGENRISFMDRLWSPYQLFPMTQVLVRKPATSTISVGRAPYGLRYALRRVLTVRTVSTVFRLNSDYMLSENQFGEQTLTWMGGKGPADGERFSISYEGAAIWRVLDFTFGIQQSIRRKKQVAEEVIWMPVTALIKLEWLVVDQV